MRALTDLPLWMTEGGYLCHRSIPAELCNSDAYEQSQAAHVAAWAGTCSRLGLESCVWYSLTRNGWQKADLMTNATTPRLGWDVLAVEMQKPRRE